MAVETAPYINSLDATQPNGASPKAEGDDHIRVTKGAIKATWPNITGPVNATQAQLNLLVGKTSVATIEDIEAATLEASIPGVNDPANAELFFQGGGEWVNIDLRGEPAIVKADSGTTAQVLNYTQGEGQTITATGAHSLTATGFPAGRLSAILARLRNYGAFPLTTTGITWIKADGTETTNFSEAGITLRTVGASHVLFFSYGDGIVYAKAP